MRWWLVVLLLFIVTACSHSPEVQNGIVMTPELKVLEKTLQTKFEEILLEGARDREFLDNSGVSISGNQEPNAVVPQPSVNDDIAVIDFDTNYAYSNKIGFYREAPYVMGVDGIYRNSVGEVLSVITPTQMREMQTMPQSELQAFLSHHMAVVTHSSLDSADIDSLAMAVHAPYRQIDTNERGWYQLQGNVQLGINSRMGASGVGVESANVFVGVTSEKTVMDIGFYSNSYFYDRSNDTNPGWGGFVNIYDTGRWPTGKYYDFGSDTPTCCGRIVTKTDSSRYTTLWVRNELDNGGLVAAVFKYYDQLVSGNPQVTVWRYFTGLSARQADVKLYRSTSLLSKDGARSFANNWATSYLWRTKTEAKNNWYRNFSRLYAKPNTYVTGNEYPYETCPERGGKYQSGPVLIQCSDSDENFNGFVTLEVKY